MRLHLNIRTLDDGLVIDPDGQEFEDIAHAKAEAEKGAREVMADALRVGEAMHPCRTFEITDEKNTVLLRVSFLSAMTW
jgi:hypothetical protein